MIELLVDPKLSQHVVVAGGVAPEDIAVQIVLIVSDHVPFEDVLANMLDNLKTTVCEVDAYRDF